MAKASGRLPVPSPLASASSLLSSRLVGSRSSSLLQTIARLRLLFSQHLFQPPVRAGLLPKEAPDDQNREGEAEGQHPPPGPLLLLSQGMLHRPAGRMGSARGEVNGTVRVVLFLGRGRGLSPATERRLVSGSPAHEPKRPDGPGRETAVSAPASGSRPRPLQEAAQLTRRPAHTRRRTSRLGLHTRRRGAACLRHFRCAKPEAGRRSRPPFTTTERGSTRATEMTRTLRRSLPSQPATLGRPPEHAGKCSSLPARRGRSREEPGCRARLERDRCPGPHAPRTLPAVQAQPRDPCGCVTAGPRPRPGGLRCSVQRTQSGV